VKLRWLPEAAEDLREIHDFLRMHSPDMAHRIVNEIYDAARALTRTPYIGRPNTTRNTRELILVRIRHKIVYRVHEDAVLILRIRHTARGSFFN
jgi:plasmid stabilization system protein ParE